MSRKRSTAKYTHNEFLQFVHDWRNAMMETWSSEEVSEWLALPHDNSEESVEQRIRFFQRRRQSEH